jgi:hypothetical protein
VKQNLSELEARLQSAPDQRTRIDLLNELAWATHFSDQEKARELAEQAHEFSTSGAFEQEPCLPGLAGSL